MNSLSVLTSVIWVVVCAAVGSRAVAAQSHYFRRYRHHVAGSDLTSREMADLLERDLVRGFEDADGSSRALLRALREPQHPLDLESERVRVVHLWRRTLLAITLGAVLHFLAAIVGADISG